MAESIVNNSEGINWHAYSARTQPAGSFHLKDEIITQISIQFETQT